jgi:hypothetical protein
VQRCVRDGEEGEDEVIQKERDRENGGRLVKGKASGLGVWIHLSFLLASFR